MFFFFVHVLIASSFNGHEYDRNLPGTILFSNTSVSLCFSVTLVSTWRLHFKLFKAPFNVAVPQWQSTVYSAPMSKFCFLTLQHPCWISDAAMRKMEDKLFISPSLLILYLVPSLLSLHNMADEQMKMKQVSKSHVWRCRGSHACYSCINAGRLFIDNYRLDVNKDTLSMCEAAGASSFS